MAEAPALSVRDLEVRYGAVPAVRNLSLDVGAGEIVGLIGPNGAGKSTLVNVLSGFDRPTQGSVELAGRRITRWSSYRRAKAGLARTFQHSRSFRDLTVRENVEVAAIGVGAPPRKARRRADELLELLGLDSLQTRPAGVLSHGDERRLGTPG